MDKLKLEILQKVLLLSTETEIQNIRTSCCDAISRECDIDVQEQKDFQEWKTKNSLETNV